MTESVMATIDGNEAAAYVAYLSSEVVAIYPFTLASPMGEWAGERSSPEVRNLWGIVPGVIGTQREGFRRRHRSRPVMLPGRRSSIRSLAAKGRHREGTGLSPDLCRTQGLLREAQAYVGWRFNLYGQLAQRATGKAMRRPHTPS